MSMNADDPLAGEAEAPTRLDQTPGYSNDGLTLLLGAWRRAV